MNMNIDKFAEARKNLWNFIWDSIRESILLNKTNLMDIPICTFIFNVIEMPILEATNENKILLKQSLKEYEY